MKLMSLVVINTVLAAKKHNYCSENFINNIQTENLLAVVGILVTILIAFVIVGLETEKNTKYEKNKKLFNNLKYLLLGRQGLFPKIIEKA